MSNKKHWSDKFPDKAVKVDFVNPVFPAPETKMMTINEIIDKYGESLTKSQILKLRKNGYE